MRTTATAVVTDTIHQRRPKSDLRRRSQGRSAAHTVRRKKNDEESKKETNIQGSSTTLVRPTDNARSQNQAGQSSPERELAFSPRPMPCNFERSRYSAEVHARILPSTQTFHHCTPTCPSSYHAPTPGCKECCSTPFCRRPQETAVYVPP